MQDYIIDFHCALGDVVVLSAFISDLKAHYGDELKIDVRTNHPEVFAYSPHLTPLSDEHAQIVTLDYQPYLHEARKGPGFHFTRAFHLAFGDMTGMHVPYKRGRPELFLSEREKSSLIVDGDYWVVFAGGKRDTPVKIWESQRYQQTVNHLLECNIHCVQVGNHGDIHPSLQNVIDLRGKTDVRQLFRLIHASRGVICPITSGMHIAAAFDKPAVVIAGGREEPRWEAYPGHIFLTTVGGLPCCLERGCWAQLVVPDPQRPNDPVCSRLAPRPEGLPPVPECMSMIDAEIVTKSVLYYSVRDKKYQKPSLVSEKEDFIHVNKKPTWKTNPAIREAAQSSLLSPQLACIAPASNRGLVEKIQDTVPSQKLFLRLLGGNELFSTREYPLLSAIFSGATHYLPSEIKTLVWFSTDSEELHDEWLPQLVAAMNRETLPCCLYGNLARSYVSSSSVQATLEEICGITGEACKPVSSGLNAYPAYVGSAPLVAINLLPLRDLVENTSLVLYLHERLEKTPAVLELAVTELLRMRGYRITSFNRDHEILDLETADVAES
jgi:hypothetical protein